MNLIGRKLLEKFKWKNRGNKKLCTAIDRLVDDIEAGQWKTPKDLLQQRPDADIAHKEGFYFFDLNIHRSMVLIEFEDGMATIVWCGNHDDYELTFKNNKRTIDKWLRDNNWIE